MRRCGDRPLDRGEQGLFFGGCVLCKRRRKSVLGQPNPTAVIGREFWCLRVRRIAVENVGDGFALVGRQGDHVNQRLEARMVGCADNAAGVRVAGQHDRSFGSIDSSLDGVHVIVECGERDRSGGHVDPGVLQTGDERAPARPVGPRSVDENDSGCQIGRHNPKY